MEAQFTFYLTDDTQDQNEAQQLQQDPQVEGPMTRQRWRNLMQTAAHRDNRQQPDGDRLYRFEVQATFPHNYQSNQPVQPVHEQAEAQQQSPRRRAAMQRLVEVFSEGSSDDDSDSDDEEFDPPELYRVMYQLHHLANHMAGNVSEEERLQRIATITNMLVDQILHREGNFLQRLFAAALDGQLQNQGFQGQPPASQEAKQSLKRILQIGTKLLERDGRCTICLEDFGKEFHSSTPQSVYFEAKKQKNAPLLQQQGDNQSEHIRQLPCRHIFHQGCLFNWLDHSNHCPTCRYELMTDNVDFNRLVKIRMADRDQALTQEEDVLEPQNAIQLKKKSSRRKRSADVDEPISAPVRNLRPRKTQR